MVNTKLAPEAIQRFSQKDRECALRMSVALEGAFKTYALAAQDERFGGLDYVGVGVYEALLRKVPGVRIGHVLAGAVVWE
jgi:hypothetical protein